MSDRSLLPEDLSVLARQGELSPAEERRFEVYARASAVTWWLHQLGRDYDAMRTEQPGDDALIRRAVERVSQQRAPSRRELGSKRVGVLLVLALAGSAAAAIATGGALGWFQTEAAEGGVPPSAPAAQTRGVPGAGAPEAPPQEPVPSNTASARASPEPQPRRTVATSAPSDRTPGSASASRDASASAAQMFSHANQLRQAGQRAEAVAAYRALQQQYPNAPEASVSHVLLGRILLRHAGPDAAHREFERYLARNPQGSPAEEALSGSAAALRSLGRHQDERRVWQSLLSRFPNSIYAGAARERLNELE